MIIAILISLLIWSATIIGAVLWSRGEYERGYKAGYDDASEWVQRHEAELPTAQAIVYADMDHARPLSDE